MDPAHNGFNQANDSYANSSSLDAPVNSAVFSDPAEQPSRFNFSVMRYNRLAFIVTAVTLLLILIVGGATVLLSGLKSKSDNAQTANNAANYGVSNDLSTQGLQLNAPLQIGQAAQLVVNGQLKVGNSLVLTPSSTPNAPVAGQIYYSKSDNAPYYYNGSQFISLAPTPTPQHVTAIGGVSGNISIGNGLQVTSAGQLSLSTSALQTLASGGGVTSFQGKTGAVSLSAGNGIGIDGTTVRNTGVVSLASGSASVVISQDGQGNYTLSDSSVVASGSAGQIAMFTGSSTLGGSVLSQSGTTLTVAGSLTVTGAIKTNSIAQTAAGNNVSVSAGNDAITFTAGGRNFVFPTSGAASQMICTSGALCASGGGVAVLMQPGSAQADSGSGSSVFINNIGGGNLLQLQGAGSDRFVVTNAGNTTIAGSLTLSGLGVGIVQTNGFGVVSSTTLDRNSTSLTGQTNVANGGTGSTTAAGARTSLGAAASGANSDITSLSAATSVGSTGAALVLQGNAGTSLTSTNNGFTTTVGFSGTAAHNVTYNFDATPAAGTYAICTTTGNCAGAGGGVTTTGGTTNQIALFTGSGTIGDSILSQTGTTVTVAGTLSATTLQGSGTGITNLDADNVTSGTLTVANGGTGAGSFTQNGIIYGNGTGALAATAAGTTGDCLVGSTGAAPSWQSCSSASSGATPGGPAGGDLSGSYPNPTVVGLNGSALSISGLGSGNFLVYNGTNWVNKSFSGDLTVTSAGVAAIATGAVTGAKIANSTITNSNLQSGSFTNINGVGTLTVGTWNATTIGVAYGGTGLATTPGNGELLIGNGSGYALSTLSNSDGTVSIVNGPGSITLSVPRADQCSTCADYTLSNLADVIAINKSLLPATAGSIDLGGSSVPYRSLYLSGSSTTPASNNFTITGNASSARTITLPDADGTLCLTGTCIQLQSGSPPGTAQTGNINLNGTITSVNVVLSGIATVNNLAPAASTALTLGATGTGQTTNLQGSGITFTNGAATYSFNSSASGSHTLCDDTGNCAGTGGGVIASGGTAYNLPVFTGSNTLVNSIVSQDAGATTATVAGLLKVNGTSITGAGALAVASTGGTNALSLNSGSGTLVLAGSTGTIQRSASSLTLDVTAATTSTVTITNSNASNVANLSVEGGVNIGSGQSYKINGNDINTAGTLSNIAYLNQNNAFTGTGDTTFAGTVNGQTIGSSSAFTGTVSVAGANALSLGQASTNSGAIIFKNSAGANTVTLKAGIVNPAASFALTLPAALGASGDCLEQVDGSGTLGFVNCSGGVGGSGTANYVPVFGAGGTSIGNSNIQSFTTGGVAIQNGGLSINAGSVGGNGASSLVLGTASSATGNLTFNNETNANTVSLQSATTSASYTLTLPTSLDTTGKCLNVGAGGQIGYFACISSGGGGGGSGVTSNSATTGHLAVWTDGTNFVEGDSIIQDNGSRVGIGVAPDASAVLTVGSSAAFKVSNMGALTTNGITNNGGLDNGSHGITNAGSLAGVSTLTATGLLQSSAAGQALTLSGAPTNSATQSLAQLGSALVGGNSAANGGTYLGINEPASGAGSAADFVNFQNNGSSKFKVDSAGNLTAGTINGVTIGGTGALTSGGYTLTLTGNSTLNQNLTTTSSAQFGSLTLGTALAASQGGTGTDTSGASAGSTLIFNATTGKFEANQITSTDASLTVTSTDGHIDLKVASCVTCATTDLSNLAATTSLNSTLQAQAGVDLGSSSSPFRNLYISGGSGSRSSNNFELTGTATAHRTITLPDADGTLCITTSCVTLQGGSPSAQTGTIDITGSVLAGTNLTVGGTATISSLAPPSSTALTIGATGSGQTTKIQSVAGGISFLDGTHTYNFSDAGSGTHAICDDTGNCAGAGGGALVTGGSAFNLPVFNNSNTLVNSIIAQDAGAGATTATVSGKLVVSATNTSGSSLAVSNSSLNSNNASLTQLGFTNANTGASSTTINGVAISPTGTNNGNANANILNGIKFNNVAAATNNSFYALNFGTGYNALLQQGSNTLINGSGLVQNVAFDSTLNYSNLTKVTNLTLTGTLTGVAASFSGNVSVTGAGGVALNVKGAAGNNIFQALDSSNNTVAIVDNLGNLILQQNVAGPAYTQVTNHNSTSNAYVLYSANLDNIGIETDLGSFAPGNTAVNMLAGGGGIAGTSFLGVVTVNSNPILFGIGGGEVARFDASGKFGLGTSSPAALFSVGSGSPFQVDSTGNMKAATGLIQSTSSTALRIQNGSSQNVLTVDTTAAAKVTIGQASAVTGSLAFASASGGTITLSAGATANSFTLNLPGTAPTAGQCLTASSTTQLAFAACAGTHNKTLTLTPEFTGAVLDAANDTSCSSANSGIMTSGLDDTNRKTYYDWTSSQTTSQCYDVVVAVPVPTDWSSWSSTPFGIDYRTDNASNVGINIKVVDTNGTTESGFNYTAGTISGTGWTGVNYGTGAFSGTYSANGVMLLKIRMSAKNGSNLYLGNIRLGYNSAY